MDENRATDDSATGHSSESANGHGERPPDDDGAGATVEAGSDAAGPTGNGNSPTANGDRPAGDGNSHSDGGEGAVEASRGPVATGEHGRSETDAIVPLEDGSTTPVERSSVGRVREYLRSGESLRLVDSVTLLGDHRGPATIGLTDGRMVVVTERDEFIGVGFDRICAVRSHLQTTYSLRGADDRVLLAVGYVFAVFGFLGVLSGAVNPLTPALALVTFGGVMLVDHVRREGVDPEGAPLAAVGERLGASDGRRERLRRLDERLNEAISDDGVALGGAAALASVPFLAILTVENSHFTAFFALLTVASISVIVYAFRHRHEMDGFEIVRQRRRTISADVDGGGVVTVRTGPNSSLHRDLAGYVGATPARAHSGDSGVAVDAETS